MRRALILVSVAACAKIVGIHDYDPTGDASGPNPPSFDAPGTIMPPPPPCGSGWGGAGCVTSLAAGVDKTCAVADNVVYCWGNLPGNGSSNATGPVAVTSGSPANVSISTSSSGITNGVTCIDAGGKVTCWGDSSLGQQQSMIGTNAPGGPFPEPWSTVAVGEDHACGLSGSAVSCWGADDADQLGTNAIVAPCGAVPCSRTPFPIDMTSGVVELASGGSHTCVRYDGGSVACWGSDSEGQLGNNLEAANPVPQTVVTESGSPIVATRITAGLLQTCALDSAGDFACWGAGGLGQRGDGEANDASYATFISPTGRPFTAIATGENNTCAIDAYKQVWCWGDSTYELTGPNPLQMPQFSEPTALSEIPGATVITVGKRHACALLETGGIVCWGDNSAHELGVTGAHAMCGTLNSDCSADPITVPPPM
jgi:hypothetical protein